MCFFQWNTEGTDHSYKAWGHAVTEDFVHYTYYEPALLPDESYDKEWLLLWKRFGFMKENYISSIQEM